MRVYPYARRSWRVALALTGQRLERRLGRQLTEEEWVKLEATRFGSDHLLFRAIGKQHGWQLRPFSYGAQRCLGMRKPEAA